MAYIEKGLRRITHGGVVAAGMANINSIWSYFSNDTAAQAEAAGYFNGAAKRLTKGDLVFASLDLDGAPVARKYLVTSNDGSTVTIVAAGEVQGGQANIADLALTAVTGVDGTGSNAASKADVDARLTTINAKVNAILTALEASGHNLTS